MSDPKPKKDATAPDHAGDFEVVDAIRHVGPTLEAEGIFLPRG